MLRAAALQGEWVLKNMPNGARVAVIAGQSGSSTSIDRVQGIHDALKEGGEKYKIVAEQPGDWDRAKSLTVAQNILTSLTGNPPDVMLVVNDDMALGALEAIRGMGLSGKVKLVSYDAYPEALKAVKAGEMIGTVDQGPSKQVRTALQSIVNNIRNKSGAEDELDHADLDHERQSRTGGTLQRDQVDRTIATGGEGSVLAPS